MSDTEARAAERGDDEAAALVAWRRTHDPRACPVCGWAGKGLTLRSWISDPGVDWGSSPAGLVEVRSPSGQTEAAKACGRCGVAYVEDAAGLSLECMELEAARRGEAK